MILADFENLKTNYENILKRMKEHSALRNSEANKFRPPQLVAVSKLQPLEKILPLAELGQTMFGENYVQEFSKKKILLESESLRWHFIGQLQSNKLKEVIGKCEWIHSIDSIKNVEKIESFVAEKKLSPQKILLQVKSGPEVSKAGLDEEQVRHIVSLIGKLNHVKICGLMTLPPLQSDPERNRAYFRKLRQLLFELNDSLSPEHHLSELSMGTSHDYGVAIEEGATFVRVGTELFGQRPTKKEEKIDGSIS